LVGKTSGISLYGAGNGGLSTGRKDNPQQVAYSEATMIQRYVDYLADDEGLKGSAGKPRFYFATAGPCSRLVGGLGKRSGLGGGFLLSCTCTCVGFQGYGSERGVDELAACDGLYITLSNRKNRAYCTMRSTLHSVGRGTS
jgi:hypothetical protein